MMTYQALFRIFLLFHMLQDGGCAQKSNDMQVGLRIDQTSQGLYVETDFKNKTGRSFFLNKLDIGLDGKIRSKIFIIKERDETIPYEGIMMKRGIAKAEDFVLLRPGENIKTRLRLDDTYGFKQGRHQYTIQYSYYHSSPEENPQLNKLESDVFSFSYEKK